MSGRQAALLAASAVYAAWLVTCTPAVLAANTFDEMWSALRLPAWVLALTALAMLHWGQHWGQSTEAPHGVETVRSEDSGLETYAACCQTKLSQPQGGCCQDLVTAGGEGARECPPQDTVVSTQGCCSREKSATDAACCAQETTGDIKSLGQSAVALKVYYGSTTGTAKGFAQALVSSAHRAGLAASLGDLTAFEPDEFVVSGLVNEYTPNQPLKVQRNA